MIYLILFPKQKAEESSAVLLSAELSRAGLEPGDTEQIIHHLHRELLEAQELANTGKQKCLGLQGQSSFMFCQISVELRLTCLDAACLQRCWRRRGGVTPS